MKRLAYTRREFWERFAPWASAAFLAQKFPPSAGGLTHPGWAYRIRMMRPKMDDLPWIVVPNGAHAETYLPKTPFPEPIYEDDLAADAPAEQVHEQIARDLKLERINAELRDVRAKYDAVVKRSALHEAVLETVRDAVPIFRSPEIVAPHVSKTASVEDAILGWADAHGGERVSYEVMGGLNCYDPAVTCRRLQYTVDKTIGYLFGNLAGTRFEHLHVFDLGDNIAGNRLDDNKATNALGVFQSCVFMAEIKARALAELSAYLPVDYWPVPGNHGRLTEKMPWKQPSETADWLIASLIEIHMRGNDRVTVHVPTAWSAVVSVRGHNHWLNHGYAAAKGGNGGIPWYAYMRRDGKWTAIEGAKGERIRYRWYGHIHTQAEIPKMGGSGEQFIVGSLKGGDEYALNELGEYGDPVQKLVGCSEKYGTTWRLPLDVRHGDETPSRYEDAIPEGMR